MEISCGLSDHVQGSGGGDLTCYIQALYFVLQCKTSQKGVKEGPKTRVSSVLVLKLTPPPSLNKKAIFLKKLYSLLVDLLGRGIRLLVVLEGKGTGVFVV